MNGANDDQFPPPAVQGKRNENRGTLPYRGHERMTLEGLHDDLVQIAQQIQALFGDRGGNERGFARSAVGKLVDIG